MKPIIIAIHLLVLTISPSTIIDSKVLKIGDAKVNETVVAKGRKCKLAYTQKRATVPVNALKNINFGLEVLNKLLQRSLGITKIKGIKPPNILQKTTYPML